MISRRIIGFLGIFSLGTICIFINKHYIQSSAHLYKSTTDPHFVHPYIAVLVEFRSTPLLVAVVLNVMHNIPASWPIQIFHGKNNLNFLRNSQLSVYIKTNRILLHELDSTGKYSMGYVSALLTNSTFWRLVKGEKVLFFQLDSIFCSNSPHKLNDFLKYDYIGAPWHSQFKIPVKVGNGGISLRSRSKVLELLSLQSYDHLYHEDVWFSRFLHLVNANIAPIDIAMTFSVETIFYPTPMAVHKPIYLTSKELKALCESCPELRIIPPFLCGMKTER
jgi:hypothetical protein